MKESIQRPKEWPGQHVPAPHDVAAALAALSEADLLRLRAIARLRARALPGDLSWSDLLNEAVLRALSGTRPWPHHVPLVAFLAGVMRSLCDEWWRYRARQYALPAQDAASPADDPERAYAAAEALAALHRVFVDDPMALKVLAGLMDGLDAENIRRHYGLDAVEYDTVRRRMRRAMLRHGLTWSWP